MRIKLDENMPELLIAALGQLGHDVDTVRSEGIQGVDDEVVWSEAQAAGRVLITQDMDFSDLRRYVFGHHCGLLVVRLREPGLHAVTERLTEVFRSEDAEAWGGCFVVITDHKVRVRRSG